MPDDLPTHFGRRLRELRLARGLSMYRLAQLSGLTGQAVANLERGARPYLTTVRALAAALDVPLEDLAGPPETIPG